MDISLTFTPSTSLSRHRRLLSPAGSSRHLAAARCRRGKTFGELQTAAGPGGRSGSHAASVPVHKVTVHDRQRGVVHEFSVPEDQYILHTAESQNVSLPFACRHGCCTSCAVRIKSGQIR
ncbi:ferredoxin C 2, chloroplastic-like [Rhodamnia argentea]|uniref:Ferredoxin C 2, chloroplastic-like n=1 Tax=Rhodamnia argentea TaxID=178133 RepID=A0A8B8N6H7_9MYRT|nr:ferredoxin C 2, chloroplastic-like [Rhodamnia argentea]